MNYFIYDDINSSDFNVFISGESTYSTPERDIELIAIKGRNGTLSIDNGRFANINISYPAFIVHDFRNNFDAVKAALLSKKGYKKLSDTYDQDHYRLARYYSGIDPQMDQLNRHGTFDIIFDCDPRRFLKSGDRVLTFTSAGSVKNPTRFKALPLIRAYGTGSFSINGVSVHISSLTSLGYTDIDCETQEAYAGTNSRNSVITLANGEFPALVSGINSIVKSGITKLEMRPRWWTI